MNGQASCPNTRHHVGFPRCRRYSGKTLEASPWEGVSPIQEILHEIETAAGLGGGYFNCVLLNWYRDGTDYMGWHSGELVY